MKVLGIAAEQDGKWRTNRIKSRYLQIRLETWPYHRHVHCMRQTPSKHVAWCLASRSRPPHWLLIGFRRVGSANVQQISTIGSIPGNVKCRTASHLDGIRRALYFSNSVVAWLEPLTFTCTLHAKLHPLAHWHRRGIGWDREHFRWIYQSSYGRICTMLFNTR